MPLQQQPTNAGNKKQTNRHNLALHNQTTHAYIKLKYFFILYKTHPILNLILAKIWHRIGLFTAIFPLLLPLCLSSFEHTACILHHFAFLVWPKARNFSSPNTHFQALKPHFLMGVLPLLVTYLVVLKGYIHTIAVYFYAYGPTFSGKKHCI